ncbi:MAG: GDSL-type esterase/lipase family protein [Bacteroidales bacterium]|nr:GDSL-type esterase/lipase family protein [Bacteroidales bacterium]
MELISKYPFLKKILNYKLWGIILLIGVLLQLLGFYFYSYHSFTIFSGILFLSVLWWLIYFFVRNKSVKTKLVVNSVFIALLVAEILLRFIGSTSTYMERRVGFYESSYNLKNASYWINRNNKKISKTGEEFNFYRECNSMGYSDKEWNWKDMKSKTRILALGDSFTEGDGADADSTWVKFLERKIKDTSFYFMNGGICGSDPVFELYKLQHIFLQFKPDIVVVCINYSDIQDVLFRGGYERFKPDGVKFKRGPWWEPIYAMSHLSRLFFRLKFNQSLIAYNAYDREQEKSLSIIKTTIDSIKQLSDNNSIELVFVFHPMKESVKEGKNPFKEVIEELNDEDISTINLFEYYSKPEIVSNINDYYWVKDGHHNAKGYKLMAEGIYEGFFEHYILIYEKLNN